MDHMNTKQAKSDWEQHVAAQLHWDVLKSFEPHTAIEIRFHANHSGKSFQLLATATQSGSVHYTLHDNPRTTYQLDLNYVVGHAKTDVTLPLKAYSGWQADVLDWVLSNSNYEVDGVY
jgi:hypothetical protein